MDGPLATSPNDSDAIERFFRGCSRERRGEPFNRVASCDQSSGYFEGESLGSPCAGIVRAAPIENQDSQVRYLTRLQSMTCLSARRLAARASGARSTARF